MYTVNILHISKHTLTNTVRFVLHHHIHTIVLRFSVFITDPLGPATMVLLTKPTRQIIQKG